MAYQASNEFVSEARWNEYFRSVWEDVQSVDEAEQIMQDKYKMFPVTNANYELNGTTMVVNYTCDKCN